MRVMASSEKQTGTPAKKVEEEHAADMAAAKQALARVSAKREASAEALRNVSSGGRGGSKVSGRGQPRGGGSKTTSVSKSGDR